MSFIFHSLSFNQRMIAKTSFDVCPNPFLMLLCMILATVELCASQCSLEHVQLSRSKLVVCNARDALETLLMAVLCFGKLISKKIIQATFSCFLQN